MYRLALLLCLSFSLLVSAQQSAPQHDYSSQSPAGVTPAMMKAPEQGHPLDPHDVAVLTGKDKAPETTAYQNAGPYLASGYGYGYGTGFGMNTRAPFAGDAPGSWRDLSVPSLPLFTPRGLLAPLSRHRLGGSLFRFPRFGHHRPGFFFVF